MRQLDLFGDAPVVHAPTGEANPPPRRQRWRATLRDLDRDELRAWVTCDAVREDERTRSLERFEWRWVDSARRHLGIRKVDVHPISALAAELIEKVLMMCRAFSEGSSFALAFGGMSGRGECTWRRAERIRNPVERRRAFVLVDAVARAMHRVGERPRGERRSEKRSSAPKQNSTDKRVPTREYEFDACRVDMYECADVLLGMRLNEVVRFNGKGIQYVASSGLFGDPPKERLYFAAGRPIGLQRLLKFDEVREYIFSPPPDPKEPIWADVCLSALGQVYPGLSAIEGFIADEDHIEVKRAPGDDESWFLPMRRMHEVDRSKIVREKDGSPRVINAGQYATRIGSLAMMKSQAYYTPDVLADCLTHYTLKEIVATATADEMLDITICDPCMGANAIFLCHAVDQLALLYLRRKQEETGEPIPSAAYPAILRRVKQKIAGNVYGVDLDPMSVEIGKTILALSVVA